MTITANGLVLSLIGLVALSAEATAKTPPAPLPPEINSHGQIFEADLVVNGVESSIGPFIDLSGDVGGHNAGSYNRTVAQAVHSSAIPIATGNFPVPELVATVNNASVSVSGTTSTTSAIATSSASIQSLSAALQSYSGKSTVSTQTYLTITASGIQSQSTTSTGSSGAVGNVSISALSISGPLLPNGLVISYAGGSPAPNTVLYSDPTLTVTLNSEIYSSGISCSATTSPNCTASVDHLDTYAVVISFNNEAIAGDTMTGTITLGRTHAHHQ